MSVQQLSTIPYSILDLAMVTENSSISDSFSNSVDLAQTAEKLGFTRYWLAEHHNMSGVASSATSVLIGHLAGKTSSIRLGSGGIMLPNHAPLQIAEQFGTLETLYPNRIDLGLGRAPGTDQVTAQALNRDPRAAMEFPQRVAELQHYINNTNETASVRAFPGEGANLPLWILGSSTDSAYLAAELGLPYAFASHFAPTQLMQALSIYRHNFKPSAQLTQPYVLTCVSSIVSETTDEAHYLSSSFKKMYTGIITGKREKLGKPFNPELLQLPPDVEAYLNQMTKHSFIGDKETVKKALEEFVNSTQTNELMFTGPIYDPSLRIRSFKLLSEIFN